MKELSITSKKAWAAIQAHKMSNASMLWDVYESYSKEKEKTFDYCMELFKKYDGSMFRIIGHNKTAFSVGFYGIDEDDNLCFFYITRWYDYKVVIKRDGEY